MCGLAGELAPRRRPDVDAVRRMAATMHDRGPDGDGSWAEGPVTLAHRRLKVIDPSSAGDQPMVDDGAAIAFNGCVYNYRELRVELERHGHRFRSASDTEVILKAYRQWGARCVERFAGIFAFAIYDRAARRLVLARDRLGIKPLYTAEVDGALRFASTLPALTRAGGVDTGSIRSRCTSS